MHKVISSVIKDLIIQIEKDNENIKFLHEFNIDNFKEKSHKLQKDEIIVEADKYRITQVMSKLSSNPVKLTKNEIFLL